MPSGSAPFSYSLTSVSSKIRVSAMRKAPHSSARSGTGSGRMGKVMAQSSSCVRTVFQNPTFKSIRTEPQLKRRALTPALWRWPAERTREG